MVKLVSVGHAATRIVSIRASLLRQILPGLTKTTPVDVSIEVKPETRQIILTVVDAPPEAFQGTYVPPESSAPSVIQDDPMLNSTSESDDRLYGVPSLFDGEDAGNGNSDDEDDDEEF
jgi:hypothetical protein